MSFIEFSQQEIVEMESRFRVQLINSLGGYKSVCLIGTQNKKGQINLGMFNTIFHLGSSPAYYGFVSRPSDRERHTLENIMDTKSFTINQVHKEFYKNAHQASAKYAREVSEFDRVNLNPEFKEGILAPFVKESKIKFSLELAETHKMLNKNTMVIGSVKSVCIEHCLIDEQGFLKLDKSNTIAGSGCDAYYETTFLERLPYATPEEEDKVLNNNIQ